MTPFDALRRSFGFRERISAEELGRGLATLAMRQIDPHNPQSVFSVEGLSGPNAPSHGRVQVEWLIGVLYAYNLVLANSLRPPVSERAIRALAAAVYQLLQSSGWALEDIDRFRTHSNQRFDSFEAARDALRGGTPTTEQSFGVGGLVARAIREAEPQSEPLPFMSVPELEFRFVAQYEAAKKTVGDCEVV